MKDIYVVADNIISPLGVTTVENFAKLRNGVSAVARQERPDIADQPFYAALLPPAASTHAAAPATARKNAAAPAQGMYSRFESLLVSSIGAALDGTDIDPRDPKTILILSTTKGNIPLLETGIDDPARFSLPVSARVVGNHFCFHHPPVVISNACISGILALITAMRLIRSGRFDNAVVAGADLISKFVLSGFASFQAISAGHCRPFDRARDGINLGEGAGTVILSGEERYRGALRLCGGAVSNDANHISGPSRTGEELAAAIRRALAEAGCTAEEIDFISAHGTATLYNDEMEARAINLAGLQHVPVNSLKGYYGHTLGAAGIIESVVTLQSMRENLVLPSRGFSNSGVTMPIYVAESLLPCALEHCLKTGSGFGGCNAALVMSK